MLRCRMKYFILCILAIALTTSCGREPPAANDIATLTHMVHEQAYQMGLTEMPTVILEDLGSTFLGKASLYEDGHWIIRLSPKMLGNERMLKGVIYHELSHVVAINTWGPDIPPHGDYFQRICKVWTTTRMCKA